MTDIDTKLQEFNFYKLDNWKQITENDVLQYEKKLGVDFPQDYTNYLLRHSGEVIDGSPMFPYLESYSGGNKGVLGVLFGVLPNEDDDYDLLESFETYFGRIPNDLLPIGEDPGGNIICLGVKDKRKAKVYFWDHEEEKPVLEGENIDDSNLYLIANSFTEFILSLEHNLEYEDE